MFLSRLCENLTTLPHRHWLFFYLFFLDLKIVHGVLVQSSWSAVQESSSDVFLNAPSSLRGGRQAILLKMPGWSSYLCHCYWNERAYNTRSWTSYQSNKIVGDIIFLIPCFLKFLLVLSLYLQRIISSTSIFSSVILSCWLWWLVCVTPGL